jgi:RNA polymerase-binding transcription factor DksA
MLDVQKIKMQLEERLTILGERIEEITDELRSPNNPDFEEQATEAEGDEVLEGLETSTLAEITQIRLALKRIGDGSYGECVTCGEPIGEKRLQALPYAAQCINCAAQSE